MKYYFRIQLNRFWRKKYLNARIGYWGCGFVCEPY